ncbi:unnamed protein product [Vitrella brassicaformis CCMP3155]|uniref:Uncharacterized protein n=1 Tax=Vitrella brassicaformis (strain CCMP3155) TaxID=1169540 RepID=A0A0G4FXA3_VITBC|nr:unnamed protein product [Vitrella brassicaformis CCMP3155]|eukprot:CEM19620.1 unnamed protein product [Vitrella brassicaformis CCMP3155]
MDGGTLHSITIQEGARLTGTARQTVARTDPPLPAPLEPPPTLHALTTIAGLLREHQGLADRDWLMPSLAVVRQEGWDAYRLGRFISSSHSLRRQGGPLAQLESIGTIEVDIHNSPAEIDLLQEVLVARGCRQSLAPLHVRFHPGWVSISPYTLPVLLTLNRLVTMCCRPDAQLTTTGGFLVFDLSIFYDNAFPTHPSPSFKAMMQQFARKALEVNYIFTQDGLTDPHTNPSQSAIDIASSLSFDKATLAFVINTRGFQPPANTLSPHPAIITHLQPLPKFTRLYIQSKLGGAAARLLAGKMAKEVERVDISEMSGDEKVGVLAALGRETGVGEVVVGDIGVDQLEQLLMGAAGRLPTIRTLEFTMTLPPDVEDAGSVVRDRLLSLIDHIPHLRGLQSLKLMVCCEPDVQQQDSIRASIPVGTNIGALSFAIPEGRLL